MSRAVICDDHDVGFVEAKNISNVKGLREHWSTNKLRI